ncbi:hypothetical protein BCR34DRAFT_227182 [Clohesyomyces aquaticus]|uniref:Uncharacterized protein n=1 Tax=Clohesyomyces aquaticus TaxID=1231657 RepID=A0A1Y1Y7Y1_9PLEO|nr:hypothetical protein BCR34DRAFT_227182 [Clohesyomyces aquaticus]
MAARPSEAGQPAELQRPEAVAAQRAAPPSIGRGAIELEARPGGVRPPAQLQRLGAAAAQRATARSGGSSSTAATPLAMPQRPGADASTRPRGGGAAAAQRATPHSIGSSSHSTGIRPRGQLPLTRITMQRLTESLPNVQQTEQSHRERRRDGAIYEVPDSEEEPTSDVEMPDVESPVPIFASARSHEDSEPASLSSQVGPEPEPILEDVVDDPEYEVVDVGSISGQETIDHDRYVELVKRIDQDCLQPLVDAAYEDEIATGSTYANFLKKNRATWQSARDEVLTSMHQEVIVQACSGNIARAFDASTAAGTALAKDLVSYRKRAEKHPSIYLRIFCHKETGHTLTVADAKELVSHAVRYAYAEPEHAEMAFKIDRVYDTRNQWIMASSTEGGRWYLKTSATRLSEKRRNTLLILASTLSRIIKRCEQRGDTYMLPMQYIGYAMKAGQRQLQHESFASTNWLTMFTDALAQVLWPDRYSARTFTICLISETFVGPMAEMLLTRISRAYYHAGGLSIDQAGKSRKSLLMDHLSEEEKRKVWDENQVWIESHTPYIANLDLEGTRRKAWRQRLYDEELQDLRGKVKAIQHRLKTFSEDAHASSEVVKNNEQFFKDEHPDLLHAAEKNADIAKKALLAHERAERRMKELAEERERERKRRR